MKNQKAVTLIMNKLTFGKVLLLMISIFLAQGCKTAQPAFDFSKIIWTSNWNFDDRLIAIGGNNGKLSILSSKDLSVVKTYEKPNTITKLKWHPKGNLLALVRQWNDESHSNDSQAQIINTETNETIKLDNHGARGLDWNNSGTYLALGDGEGALSIFSKDGDLIKRIETGQKSITGLSWHPEKNIIVTVGSHIEIVNIDNETTKKIIPRDIEILMLCVAWHASGDFFATGDYGNSDTGHKPLLQYWDAAGNKIIDLEGSKSEYRNLKWTSDGQYLATASDRVRLWTTQGKLVGKSSLKTSFWGVDWNSEDTQLIATSESGEIILLDKKLKVIGQKPLKLLNEY